MKINDWSLFAGNERTVQAVKTMLTEHRLPQALVIEGPVGSGKKTLSRMLAAGILCGQDNPCFNCDVCRLVLNDVHPDVIWVRAEQDKATIGVAAIRKVRADAYVLPQQSDRKVFVIADPMNVEAQNALLKVLEEPPACVVFVILCEQQSSLIATVLSRVTVLSLSGVTYEQAKRTLPLFGLADDPSVGERLAACDGLLGKLLQAEQDSPLPLQAAQDCALALASGKREDFLKAVAPVMSERTLHVPTLTALLHLVRDALRCQIGTAEGQPAELLARRVSREGLLQISSLLAEYQERTVYNPNGGLFFTALCAQLFPRQ